jgi:ferredoxin-NADP reductase
MVLQLVRVTPQNTETKTLRFAVMGDRHVVARPGQFVTFTFLFDGQKVVRSYSICSSPAASGYIEITPKRVANGCASTFLNDRAAIGMTVEASGPFGQFCFDERRHKRIVLIAGGSGITPMMAMLRYIDDLGLATTATLMHFARNEDEMLFEKELSELKGRLANFQYQVILSQPSAEWPGARGRISYDILKLAVKMPGQNDFFLCGPGPFMDAARRILATLGVSPGRIAQESFGGGDQSGKRPEPAAGETGAAVEFARSGMTCSVKPGQTILQLAEEHGVRIPFGCRQGQCGTCKTRVLAGNVAMDTEQGLQPDAKAQGFVLTCVGRARGPVRLDA